MTRRAPAPLLVLISALLLAGCAPSPAPVPGETAPTTTATPAVTPSPTETGSHTVLSPTVPFAGDCASVLTDAQLDGLLGAGWMEYEDQLLDWDPTRVILPSAGGLGTLGGLECRWFADDDPAEVDVQSLSVVILPAAQAPAEFTADFSSPRCDPAYDTTGCRLAEIVGETWIMAHTGYLLEEPPTELLERAIAEVAATIATTFDGEAADRQPGWWALTSCEELGEALMLEELIGAGYRNGYYEGTEQPEQALLVEAGVEVTCPWHTGESSLAPDGEFYIVTAVVASGAVWHWEAIEATAGAETTTMSGDGEAVVFAAESRGATTLFATDGVNVVEVSGAHEELLVTLAERILEVMGG